MTLIISDGGHVSNVLGFIGGESNSTAAVTVTGAGSTWTNDSLTVGSEGEGGLSIEAGGSVSNTSGFMGVASDSTGTVTVTGTDGQGNASTWTNSADLTVGGSGTGTLYLARGGRADVTGDVTLATTDTAVATLRFYIGDDGTGTNAVGLLDVGGELRIGDGSPLFDLYAGDNIPLELNDAFTLVDYGTLQAGFAFDNLSDDEIFVAGPYSFQVDFNADLTGTGDFGIVATVVAIGLLGDFNGDGSVDAADYAKWRNDGGSQQAYETWRDHFGATAGSGSLSAAAVPEPTSALLLLLAAALGAIAERVGPRRRADRCAGRGG